jgi:hypothetical protein
MFNVSSDSRDQQRRLQLQLRHCAAATANLSAQLSNLVFSSSTTRLSIIVFSFSAMQQQQPCLQRQ